MIIGAARLTAITIIWLKSLTMPSTVVPWITTEPKGTIRKDNSSAVISR